jgi:serine/threonine protein kinase/WD40 repeat protein
MPRAVCPRCDAPLADTMAGLCPLCAGRLALGCAEAPDPPEPSVKRARMGDYELLGEIGRGAAGVVYRARQLGLERVVALKIIQSGQFASEGERKRFFAEAELAATLDHPNIVPVYQVGATEGRPFCAMKLVDGRNLATLMADGFGNRGPRDSHRPPPRFMRAGHGSCVAVASLVAKVARAMHHAHLRGVIHRDLKPGNIIVDADGEPHITDFGLARRLGADSSLTLTGCPIGTPAYMSPEQARGEKTVTTAADIWSLGVILYELLAARPPFQAENVPALLRKIVEDEAAPLHAAKSAGRFPFPRAGDAAQGARPKSASNAATPESRALVDPDLATICLRCLEKEPGRRYASAAELAEDLNRWRRNEPILARRATSWERASKWTARNPRLAGMVALLSLVVALGVGGILAESRRARRHADRADRALAQAREALWQANFDRAHAHRTSGQVGQRVNALAAVRAAAAIRPAPELREEAIAAMALVDLEDAGEWLPRPADTPGVSVDAAFELVAFGRSDGGVELRRLSDGSLVDTFTNGTGSAFVSFADAPGFLSINDDQRHRLWNVHARRLVLDLPRWTGVAVSADGHWLAHTQGTNHIVLRELPGRENTHHEALHPDDTKFSSTGSRVSPATQRVRDWRVVDLASTGGVSDAAGREARRLPLTTWPVALRFSPDGESLAAAATRRTTVWRFVDGTKVADHVFTTATSGLSWHGSEPVVAIGCDDQQARVWNLSADAEILLPGHQRETVVTWYHPKTELMATTCWDQILRLWYPPLAMPWLETKVGRPLGFSPDGQWLAVMNSRGVGRLRVHVPQECRLLHAPPGQPQGGEFPSFSPDGRFVAVASRACFSIWETGTGRLVAQQALPEMAFVAFQNNGELLTTSKEGAVLWTHDGASPASTWHRVRIALPPDARAFTFPDFSANGRRLVISRQDSVAEVYDWPEARLRCRLEGQTQMSTVRLSPDGHWAAAGYWDAAGARRSKVWIWSADDGRAARQFATGNSEPLFSPDGRWFLLPSDKDYRLFAVNGHPTNWTEVRRFERLANTFQSGWAAFSDDSATMAIQADERIIRLLNTFTGEELARLNPVPRAYRTTHFAFSRSGRWLAAHSSVGLHLWDLTLVRRRLAEMNLDWVSPTTNR